MAKQAKHIPPVPRLGRGLSSLIDSSLPAVAVSDDIPSLPAPPSPAGTPVEPAAAARTIPVDQIAPNRYQPRRTFQSEELSQLAASIAEHGILQPLLVARLAGAEATAPYMLIAGERRLRAARQAGLTNVPCIVRDASDREILEWSLIENIQRSDLNPIERAGAYRAYMDRFALTQADLAKRTGESRANVANYLRLLDLCDDVQAMLLDGSLSFGHARALAGLAGRAAEQLALARRIAAEGLPVRQTERLVAAAQEGSPALAEGPRAPARPKAPFLRDLEEQLTRAVGTRVTILPRRAKNTGRIVVEYYSLDDFDRIAAGLGLKAEG